MLVLPVMIGIGHLLSIRRRKGFAWIREVSRSMRKQQSALSQVVPPTVALAVGLNRRSYVLLVMIRDCVWLLPLKLTSDSLESIMLQMYVCGVSHLSRLSSTTEKSRRANRAWQAGLSLVRFAATTSTSPTAACAWLFNYGDGLVSMSANKNGSLST